MLQLKNIHKTYIAKKTSPVQALKNINLEFQAAGMVFLLGKSGCGKSTMLNIIGGLDSYDVGGDLIIDGKSTKDFKAKDFDSYRNHYIGMVFQEFYLLEDLSVIENVMFALELQKIKNGKVQAAEALKRVELHELEKRKVSELSGGQKQRVAIARAIVKNPEVILADEPTGDLDSETGKQIFKLLKDISATTLVVVVTHDRESAMHYGDRVIELVDGEVVSDQILSGTKTTEIREAQVSEIAKDAPQDQKVTASKG